MTVNLMLNCEDISTSCWARVMFSIAISMLDWGGTHQ